MGEAGNCAACGASPAKKRQLCAGEETQVQPAENVIHEALGIADLFVARPARWFKPGVCEFLAQHSERNAVLQSQRDRRCESIHQAGDGQPSLAILMKISPGCPVG